jgi:putative salt-induced outer membrane protein
MFRAAVFLVFLLIDPPAHAALPDPVRAMIAAAIETGDARKVDTVVELAKATNPSAVDEIDALRSEFRQEQARLASAKAREKEQAIRSAGLLELWKGRAEIGGNRSTGNTDTLGLTGALSLDRKGIDWDHKLTVRADYQQSGGRTSREKVFAAYEPRYDIRDGMFAYGLAQYDRDPFQGYTARYALSGGVGAKLVDTSALDLSLKAGPALRVTRGTDGVNDTRLAGLLGLDLDWRITDRLTLTQDTNAVTETGGVAAVVLTDSRSTTVNLITGLEAKVSDRLSTRFSYAVDYNSNPPAGRVDTDTISRFSLVYGF